MERRALITELTASQESRLDEYLEKWTAIGLSTGPCDVERAKSALASVYKAALPPLAPPEAVLVADNPLHGAIVTVILCRLLSVEAPNIASDKCRLLEEVIGKVWARAGESEGRSVTISAWDQVRDRVASQVGAQVSDQVLSHTPLATSLWRMAASNLSCPVRARVRDLVRWRVSSSVRDQAWANASDQAPDQVGPKVDDAVWDLVSSKLTDQLSGTVGGRIARYVKSTALGLVQTQAVDRMRHQVRDDVKTQAFHHVELELSGNVIAQVRNRMRPEASLQPAASSWENMRHRSGHQIRPHVWDQVSDHVRDLAGDSAWEDVAYHLGAQAYGAHEAPWLAAFDYVGNVLGLRACHRLRGLMALAHCCGWWTPLQRVAVLQHRPEEIHIREGVLHRDGGPAVRYHGGLSVWALHGVRVSQAIAETDAALLDPQTVLTTSNADVRREIVRKIGIERVCAGLGAQVIETGHDECGQPCELLSLDLGDSKIRPYVKLRHPGTGIYHIEGVPPGTTTLDAAFRFRRGGHPEPPVWVA